MLRLQAQLLGLLAVARTPHVQAARAFVTSYCERDEVKRLDAGHASYAQWGGERATVAITGLAVLGGT